jgi:hypothetical protein
MERLFEDMSKMKLVTQSLIESGDRTMAEEKTKR